MMSAVATCGVTFPAACVCLQRGIYRIYEAFICYSSV